MGGSDSRTMGELRELLFKEDIQNFGGEEKILFYLPGNYYFVASMFPLIYQYIRAGKGTIIIFSSIDSMISHGNNNVENMIKLIEKIEYLGGRCFDIGMYPFPEKYAICFCCSEYSGRVPVAIRAISQVVVAVQLTGIYNHVYSPGRFEEIFSEEIRDEIDYLVVSDYIADWLCGREEKWKEKILSFGYPKLDTLYYSMKNGIDVPEGWKDKLDGKKVFLFMTYVTEMEELQLDFFADEENDMVAIWRPHPILLDDLEKRAKVEAICKKYHIIIDDTITYDTAFSISNAMIVSIHSSDMANYLYTGKPVCIYDLGEKYGLESYNQELWYKSAYIALKEKEVTDFIKSVDNGIEQLSEKQELCRQQFVKNFDGEVCNRIYDYFEGKK